MLQQLHARDDVEFLRMGLREILGRDRFVADVRADLVRMDSRNGERLFAEIYAGGVRAQTRHRFGENPAAAANVQDRLAGELGFAIDVVQAQRIDLVQGTKLAARIPPAVSELAELGDLGRVDVDGHTVGAQQAIKAGLD